MASTANAARSQKGAAFLFLLGFVLVATGAAFAYAPRYSSQVAKVASQASAFGVQNGALVVGGLVLLGLGIVARVASSGTPVRESRAADDEALQAELHHLNDQLSTKLAQLRAALLQIHEGVTAISANQQVQLQQSQVQKPAGPDQSQDALFRLAASLDKLHAHLDERVHAVDLQLRSGFETLLSASADVRRHLEQGGFAAAIQPSAPVDEYRAEAEVHAPEGGIDFYETMQKLDAIAGGELAPEQDEAPHAPRPQAPFASQGHDDSLDALLPEEYRDRY